MSTVTLQPLTLVCAEDKLMIYRNGVHYADNCKYYRKKAYFEELTYHYISNSLKSFEKKEYLTSGVWAAVYAEALLKDILTILEIETSKEDFYILIKTLRNHVADCSQLSGKDKVYLLELAKRCDEIRNKRNRL